MPSRPAVPTQTRASPSSRSSSPSTLLMVAFLAAAALFVSGTRVSGDTRDAGGRGAARVVGDRGRAGTGGRSRRSSRPQVQPGTTVTTKTVNGLKFTVTQEMQWVAQSSTTSACDSRRHRHQRDHAGERVGDVARRRALPQPVEATTTLAPPAGAYSAATGSIARQGPRTRPGSGVAEHRGPGRPVRRRRTQHDHGGGLRVLRVPHARCVHRVGDAGTGVGDQERLTPSQTTSVTVGQTDVDDVQLRHRGDHHGHGMVGLGRHARERTSRSGSRTRACSRSAQYTFAAGTTSLTPLFPYPSGYTVFAGNCTDNNPVGLDTNRNAFYPNPGRRRRT